MKGSQVWGKGSCGRAGNRAGRQRGITLIECLVYLSLLLTVGGVAMVSVGRLWTATGRLSQNGDDVLAALRAGERWRADLREARSEVTALAEGAGCRLVTPTGVIEWRREGNRILRRVGEREVVWLERVRESEMKPEPRSRVTGWRWELGLESRTTRVRREPKFSFLGVPGAGEVGR